MQQSPSTLPNSARLLQIIPPFETWAGRTEAAIRTRLREALQAGIGGIVTNIPAENYLRDDNALEILHLGVKIAHEEGMRVWIYDEEGYPSGTAGGEVLKRTPSAEAQGLIRVVDPSGKARYEVVKLYEATHATENFYKKRHYVNILDPAAVATFLSVTHDRYARVLDPIDRYVEAFFTDEPSLISVYIPKDREYPQTLPWHSSLPDEFRRRKGYDLLPHRESLFEDTGAIDRKVRCDFYDVVADLCAETWFGGLQEWCHRHKVASSGHLLGEETMVWQTEFDGDPFACYRKFDIPGIDMITSNPEKIMAKEFFLGPKIAGSAVRLQGKKRLMCEISDYFGMVEKNHANMDQMRSTAGILFACGVTDLTSYYPVSFAPTRELKEMEIAASEYAKYTNFVARLNTLFTSGTIESPVAVVYPMTSLHAHFTPSNRSMYEDHPDPDVLALDRAFCSLCRNLLQQQIGYDIIDERSLAGANIEKGQLVVGERRYDAIALPPMDTVHLRTMELLAGFVEKGGGLFAHPLLPKYAAEGEADDGKVVALVERARGAGGLGGSMPGSPPVAYLLKSRLCNDCGLHPASPAILFTTVRRKSGPAYFFVNTSGLPYEGSCILHGFGAPVVYDPSSGEQRLANARATSESSYDVPLNLCPYESVFVLFGGRGGR